MSSGEPQTGEALLSEEVGGQEFLLGNEAIVRGALEAGVGFACGYPGTPSSEITDTFARIAAQHGIVFEYSVNEKIALEVAFGASLAGTRALVAMKHLGLMYAGDPLSTIPYIGTPGGLVIVSAGDPSCRTSPNEQDQRRLGEMLHFPVLDPASPQQALEMTRYAFELSEECRLPVLLRPTTWVCHTRATVTFGRLRQPQPARFVKDPARMVPVPAIARRLRLEVEDRLESAEQSIVKSGFLKRSGRSRLGIVSIGTPALLCEDLLRRHGLEEQLTLITLGAAFPLSEAWLCEQLGSLDRVLVVEELSPLIEDQLHLISSLHGLGITVLGKRSGHLPIPFEYDTSIIQKALHQAFGVVDAPEIAASAVTVDGRPPVLCPGCGHRSTFFAARNAFGEQAHYFSDIGCYTLGFDKPLESADALLCMGAGIALAQGVSRTTGKRTVGFIGDSTFLHSGMPPLLNAVKESADLTVVILDNEVTAMTGFQERPGAILEAGSIRRSVDLEKIVRALGVGNVELVDPNDLSATISAFRRAHSVRGVSVIICTRPCMVFGMRAGLTEVAPPPGVTAYRIHQERCRHCARESSGGRCSQTVTKPFERAMVVARSLESGSEGLRPQRAACSAGCPVDLCIQGYAAHIASGEYGDALELIMDRLPLPDSVCRVCTRPCETNCLRGKQDAPVAINDLKRFVLDWAADQDEFPYPRSTATDNGQRVAIVGAGPAGLSAAYDLRVRGFAVDLYDANSEPGGLMLTAIPRYRLPLEALRRDTTRILDAGVSFHAGRRLGENLSLEELLEQHEAVLLAFGAHRSRELQLTGSGVATMTALQYLHLSSCGGTLPAAQTVVVVGGGDAAVDSARTALRNGATHVTIVALEAVDELPAIADELDDAMAEGVVLRAATRVTGMAEGQVGVISVELPQDQAFSPEILVDLADSGEEIPCQLLISAIGQVVDPEVIETVKPSSLWRNGRVSVDREDGGTGDPQVFACGDLTSQSGTVTEAAASGLRAAWGIDRALRGEALADLRPPPPATATPQLRRGVVRDELEPRARPDHHIFDGKSIPFAEVCGSLDESQARREAERCMICGQCGNCRACLDLFGCPAFYLEKEQIRIDEALCVGCGVCAQFCPNGAIQPVLEADVG